MTTIAGTGEYGFSDGDALTHAKFSNVFVLALCFHTDGNIYVADRSNHAIRKITPQGQVITIAGNGTPGFTDGSDVQTPKSQLHLDKSTAKGVFTQFTNVTTGNTEANLGFRIGILASGNAQLRQEQNLPMQFFTNKLERMRIA